MSPTDAAWVRYRGLGLSSADPVGLMNQLLNSFAETHSLRVAVRRFVTAPEDSPEKIIAFAAMVEEMQK